MAERRPDSRARVWPCVVHHGIRQLRRLRMASSCPVPHCDRAIVTVEKSTISSYVLLECSWGWRAPHKAGRCQVSCARAARAELSRAPTRAEARLGELRLTKRAARGRRHFGRWIQAKAWRVASRSAFAELSAELSAAPRKRLRAASPTSAQLHGTTDALY